MLNCKQLTELIIEPALKDLVMFSQDAVELLLFTCANESNGGSYLHQVNGPALGIYQIEPRTYADLWENFINKKNDILMKLTHSFDCNRMPSEDRIIYDLRYATAIARIFYARIPHPLPSATDVNAIWNYYKTYYNTSAGKANFYTAYHAYIQFKSQA